MRAALRQCGSLWKWSCCHWRPRHAVLPRNHVHSTILNCTLLFPILNLLSGCINSSSLFPVAILCTLLHRENTSFEVWYLHKKRPRSLNSVQIPAITSGLIVHPFSCKTFPFRSVLCSRGAPNNEEAYLNFAVDNVNSGLVAFHCLE